MVVDNLRWHDNRPPSLRSVSVNERYSRVRENVYNHLHHFNLSLPNLCEAHEYSHVADSGVDRKGTTNTLNKSENCLIESGNIYFLESNSNISK
jgi:hypothetical protein